MIPETLPTTPCLPERNASRRQAVRDALAHRPPAYVPWQFCFTEEARQKLRDHFGVAGDEDDLDEALGNHLLLLGNRVGFFTPLDAHHVRDHFGVIWDRSVDHDIGIVTGQVLPEPTLRGYRFPDPHDTRIFAPIPGRIARRPDAFRVFAIGFSLYERAWTLRGLEPLMMDFVEHPGFVRDLLRAIADYNLAQIDKALNYDIDAVYFGDDWGQQVGLQMGPELWREFIRPELARMYGRVRAAGKMVFIHSCGDVDELFDDLIDLGVNCFNPFQPEVMDVHALLTRYRGRLAFWGGLSTQRTLPFGSADQVRTESLTLLERGRAGGYLFAPAHAVEGDVPLANMLAFIDAAREHARTCCTATEDRSSAVIKNPFAGNDNFLPGRRADRCESVPAGPG